MKERNSWLIKLASFTACLFILGYVLIPIHEDAHAKANALVGGGLATIESVTWGLGGHMNWVPGQIPPHTWFVYLAGGLGVAVVFMLAWIWFHRSKTLWDLNDELALFVWAIISIFYAAAETTLALGADYTTLFNVTSTVGPLIGLVIAVLIYFKRIRKWFTTKEEIIHIEGKRRIFEKIAGILFFGAAIGLVVPRLNAWIQDVLCKGLGGESVIGYTGWFGLEGNMQFTELPTNHPWLISAAGIIVFLIFLGLWIWAYKSPTLWDTHKEFALATWGVAELGYGGVKLYGYFYPQWTLLETMSIALPIGLAILVIILYVPKLKRWITTKEVINRRLIA